MGALFGLDAETAVLLRLTLPADTVKLHPHVSHLEAARQRGHRQSRHLDVEDGAAALADRVVVVLAVFEVVAGGLPGPLDGQGHAALHQRLQGAVDRAQADAGQLTADLGVNPGGVRVRAGSPQRLEDRLLLPGIAHDCHGVSLAKKGGAAWRSNSRSDRNP